MPREYALKRKSASSSEAKSPLKYKIDYEKELNESQLEAVFSKEGSFLLIAGAGSGKTRTLTYRTARLIEIGYDPSSIVLLTFTRKAAKEMMDRAAELLDERCSKILGGTFHSFANMLLRKYAEVINLNPNFIILDQQDCEYILGLIREDYAPKNARFPYKDTLLRIYSFVVNTNQSLDNYLEKEYPHFWHLSRSIERLFNIYQSYKAKNQLLDYDDLLRYLITLLNENNEQIENFLKSLSFIMIDEYQDTNHLQAVIVKSLARFNENVMAVGDDSQSIYSFRGADFKNIMEFPQIFPNAKIIKLEENYRSTQEILNFSNEIIRNMKFKYSKVLFSKKKGDEKPAIVPLRDESEQTEFIVQRILDLLDEGVELNDIAILIRSAYFSYDLELALKARNIPFEKFGGIKFVESAHIKDVLAFLRTSANLSDVLSFTRILNLIHDIGSKTANKIIAAIDYEILQNFNPEYPIKNLPKIKKHDELMQLLILLRDLAFNEEPLKEKLTKIINFYNPYFTSKFDDYNKREKDFESLLLIASRYENINSFLADLAIDPPNSTIIDYEQKQKDKNYITISTIHSAKGLEWNTVFIINMLEGYFPSYYSLRSEDQLEEERRLFYVAVTRAKERLYITYPMMISTNEFGNAFTRPSPFLKEIDPQFYEEWIIK